MFCCAPTIQIRQRLSKMLHIEVRGQGPDVVLLHGWAMNGAVWGEFAEKLAMHLRVHIVDLPGHGYSQASALSADLDTTLQVIVDALPRRAHWIGWSLGGMLALCAAQRMPGAVDHLVLIDTSPSFVASPTWQQGMPENVFANFARQLENDIETTMRRFLALQTLGLTDAQARARTLAQACLTRPAATRESLEAGLTLLRATQLHHSLPAIEHPTLIVQGNLDRLVTPACARALAARLKHAELAEVENAGHAPFVSHSDRVAQRIVEFLS